MALVRNTLPSPQNFPLPHTLPGQFVLPRTTPTRMGDLTSSLLCTAYGVEEKAKGLVMGAAIGIVGTLIGLYYFKGK